MTASEALQEIQHQVHRKTDNCDMTISKDCYKTIVSALEKQIPKKVIKRMCLNCDKTSCPEECENYSDLCPNCGSHLSNDVDFEYPNCPYCTQNLEWSDAE